VDDWQRLSGGRSRNALAVGWPIDTEKLNYDCVLVDADDTIWDFRRAQRHALESVLSSFDIATPIDSCLGSFKQINTSLWRQYEAGGVSSEQVRVLRFERLLDQLGQPGDATSMSSAFVEELGRSASMVDGAEDMLSALHGYVPMVLLTNGLSEVQRSRIGISGIARFFVDVVISEEVGMQKPDPEIFRLAVARARVAADSRVLMVGDSLSSDIAGALAAGHDACWFNEDHGHRRRPEPEGVVPTYTISTLGEVVSIVGISSGQ
jgi:2-haloacid dehalogenase